MDCPAFRATDYGIFDSRIAFPRLTHSPVRKLSRFELELIIDGLGGTSYIEDTAYPLKKGLFLCGKPGQHRHSQLPIYCHYVHIQTGDLALQALLSSLPDGCRLSDPAPVQAVFRELASQDGDSLLTASLVLKLLSLLRQATATELRSSLRLTPSSKYAGRPLANSVLPRLSSRPKPSSPAAFILSSSRSFWLSLSSSLVHT